MISSTAFVFPILSSYKIVTASVILFPINSPVLWTNFLEAVFKESVTVCSNCFLYFIANDKNPYLLTCFFLLGSTEYHVISIY